MAEICQKVLDGFGMPAERVLSIVVPIFKGEVDIRNISCYRAVKRLQHGIKVVETVLQKRFRRIVTFDEMQFGFMPARGTIDAMIILRKLLEEYHAKGKRFMCVLWA